MWIYYFPIYKCKRRSRGGREVIGYVVPPRSFSGANSKTEVLSRGHLHIFASEEVTNVATTNIVCRRSIFIGHPLLLNYVKVFLGLGEKKTQNKQSIMQTNPPKESHKQSADVGCIMRASGRFYLSETISNVQKKNKTHLPCFSRLSFVFRFRSLIPKLSISKLGVTVRK